MRDGQVYDPSMPRRTIIVSITVDVDDPTALRAAAIADDALSDPLVPTLDEALGDAVVDAIADHAMPSLHEQGVHAVVVDHDETSGPVPVRDDGDRPAA